MPDSTSNQATALRNRVGFHRNAPMQRPVAVPVAGGKGWRATYHGRPFRVRLTSMSGAASVFSRGPSAPGAFPGWPRLLHDGEREAAALGYCPSRRQPHNWDMSSKVQEHPERRYSMAEAWRSTLSRGGVHQPSRYTHDGRSPAAACESSRGVARGCGHRIWLRKP